MKLLIGLGNPGEEYKKTRHNIGFEVIDALSEKWGIPLNQAKHKGLYGVGYANGKKVVLLKPMTYMNLSGESIAAVMNFFKIDTEDIVVLYDDLDLDTGKVRLRQKGSAGGHNGIKSIINQLGSDQFPRIKLGIGERANADDDLKDYVLSKFSKEQCEALKKSFERAVCALELMVDGDVDGAMNKYNGEISE